MLNLASFLSTLVLPVCGLGARPKATAAEEPSESKRAEREASKGASFVSFDIINPHRKV